MMKHSSLTFVAFVVVAIFYSSPTLSAKTKGQSLVADESTIEETNRALRTGGSGVGGGTSKSGSKGSKESKGSKGDPSDSVDDDTTDDDDTCEAKLEAVQEPTNLYVQMANNCMLMKSDTDDYSLMMTDADDDTYAFTGACAFRFNATTIRSFKTVSPPSFVPLFHVSSCQTRPSIPLHIGHPHEGLRGQL